MIAFRRGALAVLAMLAAALPAGGCTTEVSGTAQPVASPTPPSRAVLPENVQFRLVVSDGTGGINVTDREGKPYVLGPVLLDGTKVRSARASFQADYAQWIVTLRLTSEGTDLFADVTTANVNRRLAIVVDQVVVSAPTIQAPITEGEVQVSGAFSQTDATTLAAKINGG